MTELPCFFFVVVVVVCFFVCLFFVLFLFYRNLYCRYVWSISEVKDKLDDL